MNAGIAAFLASVITAVGGTATSTPIIVNECVNLTRTLQLGSRGSDVLELQKMLRVPQTRYFGPLTRAALIQWQTGKGLVTSARTPGAGTTGPRTRTALACPTTLVIPLATSTAATSTPTTTSTTKISPTPPPTQARPQPSSDTRGGLAPGCASFTTPQPAPVCEWGWQKVIDEEGCYIDWDCSDPNQEG